MGRLLHIAEREVKQIQKRNEETADLQIFLDWGRDGTERLELLATVTVPKRIIRTMCEQD